MAVYEFTHKRKLNLNLIDIYKRDEFINKFEDKEVIKNIRNYKQNKNIPLSKINKYRSNMFLESEENILKHKDDLLYYLEAPTGSGKSLTSLNLALKSINDEYNKIYYVAPLNNISDQTYNVVKEYISNSEKDVVSINEREEIICDEDYSTDYLDYQLLNYPFSLISHVRLFNILFGNKRIHNLMLSMICNSVIVLDEIQAYKNKLWIHIINSLQEYSKLLNIKIIIMSATLPKMDKLMESDCYIPNLISNREYYYEFFKLRVDSNFELLKSNKNDIDEIYKHIHNNIVNTDNHRILIECLTTKKVGEMYDYLSNKYKDFKVFKILGFTNQDNRKYIINKIQEKYNNEYKNKKVILVGTQCIEAGIDIDMDIGYKDISILDADEQFIGRINRNFNNKGIVYFFDLDNEDFIYKDDYRSQFNLHNKDMQDIFIHKTFNKFYTYNYNTLSREELFKYKIFKQKLNDLQFKDIKNEMTLIDTENIIFFFKGTYRDKDNIINGEELLKQYDELKHTYIDYCEKEIKLKKLKKDISKFTYSINTYNFKNREVLKNQEKIDNMFIIEDGSNYIENLEGEYLTNKSSLNLGYFIDSLNLFI